MTCGKIGCEDGAYAEKKFPIPAEEDGYEDEEEVSSRQPASCALRRHDLLGLISASKSSLRSGGAVSLR